MKKEVRKILIFSALIWTVSNFHQPIIPTHFTQLNLPDYVFGTSYGAMVFGIFITAPIWGSLGDKGNRVTSLTISTILYGLVQISLSLVSSLKMVMLVRTLGGISSSGFHVGLMAALVDISEEEEKKLNMANYAAILSMGSAMGFFLGGILGYLPTNTVFIIQGLFMILLGLGIKLMIKETNPHSRGDSSRKTIFIWDLLRDAKRSKEVFSFWILIFLAITFFVNMAYGGNNNAFNYYLKADLNMKPIINGIWKALIGIMGLIANLSLNVWLINKTNIKKSMVLLLLLTTILAFMVFIYNGLYLFLLTNLLVFTLYIIQVPILQGFAVEGDLINVGLMAGIFNAMKSLGEMTGSIIAGVSYNYSSKLPFLIGALAFAMALLLGLVNFL